MNKEQIEEARKYFTEQTFGLKVFYDKDVISLMSEYLESKREEIERKAYEAGADSEYRKWTTKGNIFKTYDQWKESQKQ